MNPTGGAGRMAGNCLRRAIVVFWILGVAMVGLAPYAHAQSRPAAPRLAAGAHRAPEALITVQLASTSKRGPASGRTQAGIIIGTIAGATVGWLWGRSIGDDFNTPMMMTCATIGMLVGLVFTPRP